MQRRQQAQPAGGGIKPRGSGNSMVKPRANMPKATSDTGIFSMNKVFFLSGQSNGCLKRSIVKQQHKQHKHVRGQVNYKYLNHDEYSPSFFKNCLKHVSKTDLYL